MIEATTHASGRAAQMSGEGMPYGYCQCGCGQLTKPYRSSDRNKGVIKGQPRRYRMNHDKRLPASATVAEAAVSATTMPAVGTNGDGPTDTPAALDTAPHNSHASVGPYTCAGTMPTGGPCTRTVRKEGDYCVPHDPIRSMLRNGKRSRFNAVYLAQQVANEREHDLVLVMEGADVAE